MNILATNKSLFSGSDGDRPEVKEFRKMILNRLLYVFALLGLPAACIGVAQSYVQGRRMFSFLYAAIYIIFLVGTFTARRLPYRTRALILISTLFLIAFAILMRIGMSGVGMQLMLGVCFLSALFYGMRTGILVLLISLACITYVAFGMMTGFIEIYPEQMLTSKSSLAWITGLFVFFIMVIITVSAPEMLRRRIEESLDLLQGKKNDVDTANQQLHQEIQAHRQTEEELRQERQRLAAIIEGTNIGTWEWNVQTGETIFNERWADIIGYTLEEISPVSIDTWERFVHSDDFKASGDLLNRHFTGELDYYEFESRMKHKDGRWVWVLDRGKVSEWAVDGKPIRMQGTHQDITDRKRSEEDLRQSEERMRLFFERQLVGMAITSPEKGWLLVNEKLCEMLGYSPAELYLQTWAELTHPDDLAADIAQFNRLLSTEIDQYFLEKRFIRKDGAVINVNLSVGCVRNQDSSVDYVLALLEDITERKRAEETLQASEELFRVSMERAPDGVYMNDLEGNFLYGNRKAEEIIGYRSEELIGRNFIDFNIIAEGSLGKVAELLKENIEGRSTGPDELEMIRKDGRHILIEITTNVILRGGQTNVLAFVRDITERRKIEKENRSLQERLQRSEKMEVLGQLAGGVAHDLNNVLGILSGYSELLLLETPEGSHSRSHAEKILQSTEKGASIIQDLLTLARRGVTVSDVINLNGVVSGFLKTPVLEKMKDYHPGVTFSIECDENLMNIKGSPVHLEKTLTNLVSNAAESISGKGEVTIRTESRYLDKAIRGYDEIKEGDYAVLTVSDTGSGIPAESREKIFEPFYTKKKMGRSGTGLGLAIVWGTVKDHSGYIDVQTEVGQGTTFTLYFPVTREELIAQQQKAPIERYMGKGESVLVIDDVAEQRDVAAILLTRLGYQVRVVSSGEEAMEYLKSNKADILVLDMIMAPGIDGLETYQRIVKINPKQKAIIVSGFSETERVRKAQEIGAGAYVKKPYAIEKIGLAIRDELSR